MAKQSTTPNKRLFFSIIVPVFNERLRIKNVEVLCRFLQKQSFSSELIIVNDGSTDETLQLLEELQKKYQFQLITLLKNHGKGYAVKTGMQAAKGQWHVFMDLDLSVPPAALLQLMPLLEGSDVLIGSRALAESIVHERQPFTRELFGKLFTRFTQLWIGQKVSDFTCGFKCFSHQASQRIFSQLHIERWSFDAEIILIAHSCGYAITEVPVAWKHDSRTKVKLPGDLFRSLLDLAEIKYHHWRGRYG